MNENNFNEPLSSEEPEVKKAEPVHEENGQSTVKFNEDGTYSSGHIKNNDEPVAEQTESPVNNRPSEPYRENVNPYSAGARPNPNSNPNPNPQGGNPYGNNQGAPRTNYPYGNGGYPYGNNPYAGNQNHNNPAGGNNYGMPPRQNNYAYNQNGNAPKKTNGSKIFAIIAGVLCVFLVIALVAIVAGDSGKTVSTVPEQTTQQSFVEEYTTNASPVTGDGINTSGELSPKAIYQKVLPSSVGILVYDKSKTLASEGSGVLFQESTDGKYTYIVTCAHVISDSSGYIRVQLYNGDEYDAEVVGFDARTDIGVIRIEETGFTLAEIGDSSKIEVGDPVYAIGNPGGVEFANSFTNGMVSALDRPVSSSSTGYTTECIQHTSAINPGNSGGALVNAFGQVIGINSMKIVDDEYEGMGFAVPSSVFVEIVNEIMTHGYVSNRPKLGITYVPASEYSTYGMFVAIKGLPSGSIVIYEIAEDSALANTKAAAGDMIVAVNGKPLETPSFLSEFIENSNVGDNLTLSIVRINKDYSFEEFDVTVTLVEDRGDTFATEEESTIQGNFSGGNYGGSYEDYFNQYFEDYFGSYFGGGYGN